MSTNYDPLDLRGQERDRADKELRERLERQNEEADVKWLMSQKRGRRMAWRFLDQAGVFRSSFSTNAMQMAFAEGNRNYGLRLLGLIHATCPEQYPAMMKEHANDGTNDDGNGRNDH
jgi:hypothetical protein